jgi:hypothetical protein
MCHLGRSGLLIRGGRASIFAVWASSIGGAVDRALGWHAQNPGNYRVPCKRGLPGIDAIFEPYFEVALERSASRPETPNYTLYCVVEHFEEVVTSAGDRASGPVSGRHLCVEPLLAPF